MITRCVIVISMLLIEPTFTFQKSGYDVIDVEYISNIRHIYLSLAADERREKKDGKNILLNFHNLSIAFYREFVISLNNGGLHRRRSYL